MNNRKRRMSKQSVEKRSRPRSRSRSASSLHDEPIPQHGQLSSPYHQDISGPSPRKIKALTVPNTPRGSSNVSDQDMIFTTLGVHNMCEVTLSDNTLEIAGAMGLSDADIQDVLLKRPQHLSRWLPEMEVGSDSRPSTSGCMAASGLVYNYESDGSGFDSDWDDAFETSPIDASIITQPCRDIPADEDLEEEERLIITNVARGIDDEADRLLGMSTNFEWSDDFSSFKSAPEIFSGPTPGPLRDYDSAYDAFTAIWDKDIIDLIVFETNRYAQQTIEEMKAKGTLSQSSRLRRWTPTNADEIMVLFAIFQFMGIDPRHTLDEYWSKGILGMPTFRSLMTYNRFILLNKFLHFADNSKLDSLDMPLSGAIGSTKVLSRRLFKLAPIVHHLGSKFDSLYQLRSHIAIDESLTLFKGRLSWAQVIRSKAARFGIKSYELCESKTGYMARFQMYTGKDEVSTDTDDALDLGRKSATIVLELLQGLERRGHCVTMDNFYNCPSLARYLKGLGFDCLGTLRSNRRYVPDEIAKAPANVPRGTIISRHSGDLSIVSWKDNKMVNIISTFHNADTYVASSAGKTCVKPVSIRDYNEYMGGVDLKDRKLSMYLLERRRGVKWYMKIFKRLMNVSILNSLVMYTCCQQRRGQFLSTHRQFRYELAESLIAKHRASQSEISRPVGDLMRLNRDVVHNPAYFPGNANRRRCRVCYARNKVRKFSHHCCVPCDVFLCLDGCWVAWHSVQDLSAQVAVE